MDFTRAIVSTLSGVLFGIAIEKGRVHVPELIIAQMKMEHFVMMKMFLSAVASGSAALALLSTVSPQRFNVAKETYRSCLWRSVGSVGVGGALLGVGMTVAGACPGTVLVQFGAGLPSTVLVLVGGYAGALAFAVVEPWLRDHVFAPPPNVKGRFVDEHITTMSGSTMAVALSVAMAGCVFMLEQFVPWQADIGMPLDMSAGFPSLSARAWPPYVAGAIIGLLQIPVVLFLGDTIGSASSYATTVSNVCYACVPSAVSHNKHLMGAKDGWANWWQVLYAAGAVLGGHLSASASQQAGAMVAEATGVTPVRSVLGGFIILFGSRLAGGCTSGHGISGMGLMSTLSFVAVAAMFAGGMGTALLL